jgi:hypothetical protein
MQKREITMSFHSEFNNSSSKKSEIDKDDDFKKELLSFKMILGEMGIQMLVAIFRGANTNETIMMLSGVPMSCVKGRLPVLINLNLVAAAGCSSPQGYNEFYITKEGCRFLTLIGQQ